MLKYVFARKIIIFLPRLYKSLLAFHYFSSPFFKGKHLKSTHHDDSKISATSY